MSRGHLSPLFTWRAAIADSDLRASTKLVAFCLSTYMSERGDSAFPATSTLAGDASLTVRSVRRHLAELEDRGWLTRQFRTGRSTVYLATVPPGDTAMTPGQECPPTPDTGDRGPRTLVSSKDVKEDVKEDGAPAKRARARDVVWDAVADAVGFRPVPGTAAHGKRNRAVRDLKAQDATPATIAQAARRYCELYGRDRLTDMALASHYPALVTKTAAALPQLDGEEMT